MFNRLKKCFDLDNISLNIYDILLLLLPISIWFSYRPLISFGDYSGTHIELSIAVIYLVIFALFHLPMVIKNWRYLIKKQSVVVLAAFVFFSGISLFWTLNPTRGILTFGIIGLLFISFLGIMANKKLPKLLPAIRRVLIVSALIISIFAWVQMFADTLGVAPDFTLLCSGCVSTLFGFTRLTAFAIEPQFFGSLLIAPIMILVWRIVMGKGDNTDKVSVVFLTTTMFLTLSRGAIYALLIGLIVLVALNTVRRWSQSRRGVVWAVGLVMMSLVVALFIQGATATINPRVNENFVGAATKSIHQLSLGVIDLRTSTEPEQSELESEDAPVFDGYVESSTNTRLSLGDMALGAWQSSATNIIFGSGLGSAGYAMNQAYPDEIGATEITQNEYTEILLELGIIGILLFAGVVLGLMFGLRGNNLALALIVAYLIQWNFFSGYPNALHIYFVMMILFAVREHLQPAPGVKT